MLEETLLIYWRTIEHNKEYIQTLVYKEEFHQIVTYLLYQMHEKFNEAQRSGIFYICILIISKLSGDRMFSVKLRRKFLNDIGFTKIPIFIGSHLDLIFIVFLRGIIDSHFNFYFCYQNNLLAILHNIAPFAKDLCPQTCTLLLQLVKVLSSADILRSDKNNLLNLRKALNLVHKILCYQPETNHQLLFELVKNRKELEYLRRLPLNKLYPKKA
mmetsp:Transcript_15428/g.13157  ORF Transcript_15428/g.13157 Transcript_15428/m.13157 type:complete len:214 (-) Transcript_15428:893-1534(-)